MSVSLPASCLSYVPEKGTVGASGDLAPLSHLALGLIGEGKMWSPKSGWADAKYVRPEQQCPPVGVPPGWALGVWHALLSLSPYSSPMMGPQLSLIYRQENWSLEVKLGKAVSSQTQLSASGLGDLLHGKAQLPALIPRISSVPKTLPVPIQEVVYCHKLT